MEKKTGYYLDLLPISNESENKAALNKGVDMN